MSTLDKNHLGKATLEANLSPFSSFVPFFSYGGSSLFTTFAALGMVSGIHFRPRPKRNSIYY